MNRNVKYIIAGTIKLMSAILTAFLLALTFAACGSSGGSDISPATDTTKVSEATTEVSDANADVTKPSAEAEEPSITEPDVTVSDATGTDDEIPQSTGHKHSYSKVVTAATCTQDGYTTYTCACGDSYIGDKANATGHTYKTDVVKPTCTEDGYTTYTCACGDSYIGDRVNAVGHTYNEQVIKPTCTEVGYTIYTCACGESYTGNQVSATGHEYSKKVTAPTCTKDGYTTYSCRCGETYIGDKVNAVGHSWGSWVTVKEPTESAIGIAERKCSSCGTKESKNLDKLIPGHTHSYTSKVTKSATCTTEGVRTYTCSCGGSYTESIQKLGHSYTDKVTASTCTSQGYTTHTCSRCGSAYKDQYTVAKGHSYQNTVTKPACTKEGYTVHTCSVCSYSYTDSKTAPAGHAYKSTVTKPTCTKEGYTVHTCTVCTYSYTDSKTAPAGHTYKATVTKPTCTERGYTTHTCSVCSVSYTDSMTDAIGHSYSLTAQVAATCTKDGSKTYKCTRCGDTYTQTIKGAHDYQDTVIKPTCTTEGYTKHICVVCSDSYTDSKTPATGHTWSSWSTKWPTCTEDGYSYRSCSCGAQETEAGDSAYGHYYCLSGEQDGKRKYACYYCGDSYLEDLDTRYDASLKAPDVESVYAPGGSISINCYADFEDHSGYGYQGLLARDRDFASGVKYDDVDYQWNHLGYAKLSYFYTSGSYYYKVRAYKMDGDTLVYGPWSEVGTVECMNFDKKLTGSAQYSYEIYFIDNLADDIYTGCYKAIYIRTDNPNLESIRLKADGVSVMANLVSGHNYDDIEYLSIGDSDEPLHKVKGGYLGSLDIEEAGKLTIELQEATAEGYVVAKTFTVNVQDYEAAQNQWIDNVIATYTNDSMNPKEKMDAVAKYLRSGEFRYTTCIDGHYVNLTSDTGPWFVSKRWNSYVSPSGLAKIAERIGGFEEIHNCYGDYAYGTTEWWVYHSFTYVVYEGEEYYYSVCPGSETGDVGTVKMVNLENTSQFIRIA